MKWADQGFWKSLLFYRQSVLYYWVLSARYRSFTWYGAANPAIPHAGMLNEQKSDIYPLLPPGYLPVTRVASTFGELIDLLSSGELHYPIVIKPDIGLKGIAVSVCKDEAAAMAYFKSSSRNQFIIQEYIDLPREFSVLFYRIGKKEAGILSFIEKKYPEVTGDGYSNLYSLIDRHPHAYLNKQKVKEQHKDRTLPKGEVVRLHSIGNYAQGSTFHSLQHEIDEPLLAAIKKCMEEVTGIDFCRLDIKARDINSVKKGDFKIIEVNGGKSEPLHIYDPGLSMLQAMAVVHRHWKYYTRVVDHHLGQGFKLLSTAEGVRALRQIKEVVKNKDK